MHQEDDKIRGNYNMDKVRYLPCIVAEIPIAVIAMAGVICDNVIVGCCLFITLNLLFAPTLYWNLNLCIKSSNLSTAILLLLSSMPLLLFLALYLEKYFGLWITSLFCCIYFIFNIGLLKFLKIKLLYSFLWTFTFQILLFRIYFSID